MIVRRVEKSNYSVYSTGVNIPSSSQYGRNSTISPQKEDSQISLERFIEFLQTAVKVSFSDTGVHGIDEIIG